MILFPSIMPRTFLRRGINFEKIIDGYIWGFVFIDFNTCLWRSLDTNNSLSVEIARLRKENAKLNKELSDRKAGRYKIGFVTMEPIKIQKFKKPVIKNSFWKRLFQ